MKLELHDERGLSVQRRDSALSLEGSVAEERLSRLSDGTLGPREARLLGVPLVLAFVVPVAARA